ncbi:hypothetical protein BGY98DRAFT_956274 [Russula aff. rugulosa BPL654]|nr:hypothetical protein BGY98DRAFT_956274 [Russula aff. rugulosa BPL654]
MPVRCRASTLIVATPVPALSLASAALHESEVNVNCERLLLAWLIVISCIVLCTCSSERGCELIERY